MQFALSASATVTFHGERYLHAWLCHKFSGDTGAGVLLVSRARQFSSMLVQTQNTMMNGLLVPGFIGLPGVAMLVKTILTVLSQSIGS